jgi:hypothetical protein
MHVTVGRRSHFFHLFGRSDSQSGQGALAPCSNLPELLPITRIRAYTFNANQLDRIVQRGYGSVSLTTARPLDKWTHSIRTKPSGHPLFETCARVHLLQLAREQDAPMESKEETKKTCQLKSHARAQSKGGSRFLVVL